ncbi:hypothetical protein WP50_17375 [Lactiplantibacillus plantarum]|nr:hypothetical protein WP50_17375 [Lactiplantibacillus plantarum]
MSCSRLARGAQTGATNEIFLGKVALMLDQQAIQAGHFDRYAGICLLFEPGDTVPPHQEHLAAGSYAQRIFHGTHLDAPMQYRQLLADCRARGWHVAHRPARRTKSFSARLR